MYQMEEGKGHLITRLYDFKSFWNLSKLLYNIPDGQCKWWGTASGCQASWHTQHSDQFQNDLPCRSQERVTFNSFITRVIVPSMANHYRSHWYWWSWEWQWDQDWIKHYWWWRNESESSNEEGDIESMPDTVNNIEESGRVLDHVETVHLPEPGPLQGYKYMEFRPTPIDQNSPVDAHMSPTQSDALTTLKDLKKILQPQCDTGRGYKDPELDLCHHTQLDGMFSMLNMFPNHQSLTHNQWGASTCQTVIGMGWGTHCTQWLCELNHVFFTDWKVLPINPFGDWNKSLLVNKNIVNEISIYLLSLGKEITAKKLMNFLQQADIKEKYGIKHDISHKMACWYLQALGYHYQSTPKGQYVDGHKREDVVTYCERVFLLKWKKFMDWIAAWDKDLTECPPMGEGKRVIAWFHDE